MGWWLLNADTLARSRFVVSPLAETTAALLTLERGPADHPAGRAWLDRHRPAHRARLAADPVTAALLRAAFTARWNADFLTPAPTGDSVDFATELARVRATPPEVVHADLTVAAGGRLPAVLRGRTDLADRAADTMAWVWTETVEPTWPRRRRVIEADVVARTAQLSAGGWAAALDDIRPGMRWLGEGRLQINAQDNPPREISGARMFFVPVTARQGWCSWDEPHRYALVYPCSGTLADAAGRPSAPAPLAALLGPARAAVLVLLDTPKSTTVLVALTGQVLGSTGRHLRVLHDAGLVTRRRSGRSVLYYRTAAGDTLVTAARGGGSGG